ncbi:glycosyltransferase [Ruminobacter sp.]|uniref:glycosyltransferase n=1 Tax=Ruminobacter sp. TaxID=2774296 RepID=UPI0038647F7C
MFESIIHIFKSLYGWVWDFDAKELSIRQNSVFGDELADNLFWLAQKSFYVAEYDSLRIAEESFFMSPSMEKLKWLGFRFGDIKMFITAKSILSQIPNSCFKTKYDREKLEYVNENYDIIMSQKSVSLNSLIPAVEEQKLYARKLSDVTLAQGLFSLAKKVYEINPNEALRLAKKAFACRKCEEIGTWLGLRMYECSVDMLKSAMDYLHNSSELFCLGTDDLRSLAAMKKLESDVSKMMEEQVGRLRQCKGAENHELNAHKNNGFIPLRIALVGNEDFMFTIRDIFADVIIISPEDSSTVCDSSSFDCLFVTIHDGKDSGWNHLGLMGETRRKLLRLIDDCNTRNIPTLFIADYHGTGDYESFVEYAQKCRYVVTSHRKEEMLKYVKDCRNSIVLGMKPVFNLRFFDHISFLHKAPYDVLFKGKWKGKDKRFYDRLSAFFNGVKGGGQSFILDVEEQKLYASNLCDAALAEGLFSLAKKAYEINPDEALRLAEKAFAYGNGEEIGTWLGLRKYERSVNMLKSSMEFLPKSGESFCSGSDDLRAYSLMKKLESDVPQMTEEQVNWLRKRLGAENLEPNEQKNKYYDIIPLRIGLVGDDDFMFTVRDVFADVIRISPEDYATVCDRSSFDCLFVTLHDGKDSGWNHLDLMGESRRKLLHLIDDCNTRNIQTFFIAAYQVGDYESFVEYAKKCRYVVTSQRKEEIRKYVKDCKNSTVLSMDPFFNPAIYNPINSPQSAPYDVFYTGAWNGKDKRFCEGLSAIFNGVTGAGKSLKIFDVNYPENRYGRTFPEEFFGFCSPKIPNRLKYAVPKLFNWAVALDSSSSDEDVLRKTVSLSACGSAVIANYGSTVNNYFPNVSMVGEASEAGRIMSCLSEEYLYESRTVNVRTAYSKYTVFDQFCSMLKKAGFDLNVSAPDVLVVCEDITDGIKESFERQTYAKKQLVSYGDLTEKILEKHKVIAWFSDEFFYEEFYLEDMVNAFKYTSASFITKDAYMSAKGLVHGMEHSYTGSYKSLYNTVFWIDDFETGDILKGIYDSDNGYAADHFNLLTSDMIQKGNCQTGIGHDGYECLNASRIEEITGQENSGYKISVIIPVYNNGYLLYGKAFASLLRSSLFSDTEVILVDDGSTDFNTLAVEYYLLRHYGNVRLYRFPAGGSGSASRPRNKGVELATGKYVAFLDPDDEAVNDGYAELYADIESGNYDISAGNHLVCTDCIRRADNCGKISKVQEVFFFEHGMKDILPELKFLSVRLHVQLIKRKVLQNFTHNQIEGAVGEDTLYSWQLLCSDLRIHFISRDIQVYYADVESSVTNVLSSGYFRKLLRIQETKFRWLKDSGLLEAFMDKKYNRYSTEYVLKKLSNVKTEDGEESVKAVFNILSVYGEHYNGQWDLLRAYLFLCKNNSFAEALNTVKLFFGKG